MFSFTDFFFLFLLPLICAAIEKLPGISFFFLLVYFFERTRRAASMRPPYLVYLPTSTGVRTGFHYLVCLSACVSVCACLTFVVLPIARAVRMKPISTNPGSMEASEYGQTRGTCFVARRLEVVAVADLPWISCRVLGATALVLNFVDPEQSASTR